MGLYARDTMVSSERSRGEIEKTLQRYRASQFAYASKEDKATVIFEMNGRRVRFDLPLFPKEHFRVTPSGRRRTNQSDIERAYDQDIRQRWRALSLAIKAKLEAVESGITSFEEEFLAHIMLPNGQTFGQFAIPQIAEAYEHKKMPPLLGSGT